MDHVRVCLHLFAINARAVIRIVEFAEVTWIVKFTREIVKSRDASIYNSSPTVIHAADFISSECLKKHRKKTSTFSHESSKFYTRTRWRLANFTSVKNNRSFVGYGG